MKRWLRYIFRFFLILFVLLLMIPVLLYIPPIQNFLRKEVTAYISKHTDMRISVGHIGLSFPLKLVVEDALVMTSPVDTLAYCGALKADVALWPLFKKEITVRRFSFVETVVHYRDSALQINLDAEIGNFSLKAPVIDLKSERVELSDIRLADGRVMLQMGESAPDTVKKDTTAVRWKLLADRLHLENIDFKMNTSPVVTNLSVNLPDGLLTGGEVDLGNRYVRVASLRLEKGVYSYLTDTLTSKNQATDTAFVAQPDTAPSLQLWTVEAGQVELQQNQFKYGLMYGNAAAGFDVNHISVTDINLLADSIFNRGTIVKLRLNQLSGKERSGLDIQRLSSRFAMDSVRIVLNDLILETSHSQVRADVDLGASILKMSPATPVQLLLNARLGVADLLCFVPMPDKTTQRILSGKELNLDGEVTGTLERLSVKRLQVLLSPYIQLSARGELQSVLEPDQLSGNLILNSTLSQLNGLKSLIPDSALRRRVNFPGRIILNGQLAARNGSYSPILSLSSNGGKLKLNGVYDNRVQLYDLSLQVDSFPLNLFLPNDSLGIVTLQLAAKGRGFDFFSKKTAANVDLSVARLDYNGYNYAGMTAGVSLVDQRLKASIGSRSDALVFNLQADGVLTGEQQNVNLTGRVDTLDLKKMNFSQTELFASLGFTLSASATKAGAYEVDGVITDGDVIVNYERSRLRRLDLMARADDKRVETAISSGDFSIKFESADGLDSLIHKVSDFSAVVNRQLKEGQFDMQTLQEQLPSFHLAVSAGTANPVYDFLKSKNIRFGKLSLTSASAPEIPFVLDADIWRLNASGVTVDTISLNADQLIKRLDYGLLLSGLSGSGIEVASVGLTGQIEDNLLHLNIKQTDIDGKPGFDFGLLATFDPDQVRVSLIPDSPVLAFDHWRVNPGNYLSYHFDKTFSADFKLTSGNRLFSINSIVLPSERQAIQLNLKGIDLGASLGLLPFAPPIGGVLSSDLVLAIGEKQVELSGNLAVDELSYNKGRIGDLALDLKYIPDSLNNQHLDLKLWVDGEEALLANGGYFPADVNSLAVAVTLPAFPLGIANAFLPSDMAQLSGRLKGSMNVSGRPQKPVLNGTLSFDQTEISVPYISGLFRLAPDEIRIDSGLVKFDRYAVTGANKNPLVLNGTVDVSDFLAIKTDLSISATDFQLINVPKNRKSAVYGKANIDLSTTVKGPIDELVVRGNMRLLNGTEINYVMQDSPLEIKQENKNIVTFVSFSDTTDVVEADSLTRVKVGGMNVLVNVDIDNSVKMAVNLSTDGQNRINVQGGGALTYSMNTLGDSRFSGKYVLTGGTVRYSPPIISEKIFNIQEGSFVEWTGDIADPTLNITAVEVLRTQVTEEDKNSRLVSFNISINIRNTLDNLSITFDLAAPEDLTIQNQLSSLTGEQRASQAMNLLIYNTYSGPGTVGKANLTSNPLNAFIQKELNQWARNNLKNIDLSFGIDTYDQYKDGGASQRTDYSYKLSKTLFNDRVRVVIGGSFSPDVDPNENLKENLVDDISLEYMLNKRDNMFIKVFRHTGYESILEGEVVQTGFGFVVRKKLLHLRELFKLTRSKQQKTETKNE